jgi:hypothetical protein
MYMKISETGTGSPRIESGPALMNGGALDCVDFQFKLPSVPVFLCLAGMITGLDSSSRVEAISFRRPFGWPFA